MRQIKSLVLITFAALIICAGFIYYLSSADLPPAIELNTRGQPTIGYPKAKVHVVVFEEPKCSNCRDYNTEVYPIIKKEFIDTNKITYTVVPVSFLPGSMPAAIALLCIYNANIEYPNDEMFFKYLDYLYKHQPKEQTNWATPEKLVKFAKNTSPAIDISQLTNCLKMETYRIQIGRNTSYGKKVMEGVISTPTVYVNGIELKKITVSDMSDLINKVLNNEGIY